ncbi:MAG: DsrE family protein [Micrococcales bacterium]|nr:DsrE family protein [Micrococcales bacterium]
MQALMIINGSAYGLDSTYNAIRLAASMAKRDGVQMTVFLMGDGVTAAMKGQKTPDGYYKLDRMLGTVARSEGAILCCGTCMDARGITPEMLVDGAKRSTMEELTDHTLAADKVLVF